MKRDSCEAAEPRKSNLQDSLPSRSSRLCLSRIESRLRRVTLYTRVLAGLLAVVAVALAPTVIFAELTVAPSNALTSIERLARGEYLVHIAGCHACHTDHQNKGAFLAGGAAITTPFGQFYPPNITPDRETGIGTWSNAEFATALQQGIAPDGHRYFPVFPYTSYSRLRSDDVHAIKQYLDQVVSVKRVSTAHRPSGLAHFPALLASWQNIYMKPNWTAVVDPATSLQRQGAYLVEAVAHCGECHSPRDGLGGTRYDDWLRGARLPSGHQSSNLTPHADGIEDWSESELAEFLQRGRTDLGAKAEHEMREFVDHAGHFMTDADRLAIAAYLVALPPRPNAQACRQTGPRYRHCWH